MAPLIATLVANGLGLLADAITAKGKAVIEEKLGVSLEKEIQSEDGLLKLRQLEFNHQEFLIEAGIRQKQQELEGERIAQGEVTKRWEADLHSDNSLSKNIRPGVLIYLLITVTILALLDSIPALGVTIKQVWVSLFADALQVVLAAYFLARTVEKGVNVWRSGK